MLKRDAALLRRLTRDYLDAYRSLKAQIDALAREAAGVPDRGELLRLATLRKLLDGVRSEIGQFAARLAGDLDEATRAEIAQAGLDAYGFVQAGLPGLEQTGLAVAWARVNPNQVYTMFGFTDPSGPMYSNLRLNFGEAVAQQVRDSLMQGFIAGMHATQIARIIRNATGQGLGWALNTARTATLWAYRAATNVNYQRNSDVVRGWVWWSARDQRTCMSCIALHGSVHPLTEIQADHHGGRCAAVPVLASYADLGIEGVPEEPPTYERGEEWFKRQAPNVQRSMMGPAKLRAWQDGAFQFDQLTRTYYSPVYGRMLREASLKEILGDKAKLYYDPKPRP